MRDVIVITADTVRRDFVSELEYVSSLNVVRGTTVGHYTRPSLAAINSSQYAAALQKQVVGPTLASVLSDAGYTCIGLPPTPQTDPAFGFDRGYDIFENFYDAGNRGSWYRDFIAQFTVARRLYHRIAPPQAKLDDLPTDEAVVDEAVDRFNGASGPRFCWVHLNGAHRPYGRGDEAISEALDRKALFSPDQLSEEEHDEILTKYRAALGRVDNCVRDLLEGVEGDPLVVFTSDHGDEFGENGYYFHQPQRRRVADALIDVPVAVDGIDIDSSWVSLLDIAPTITSALEVDPPDEWDGIDQTSHSRSHAVTIAPWLDEATVAYQTRQTKLIARDGGAAIRAAGDVAATEVEASEVPDGVQKRLRRLGYAE